MQGDDIVKRLRAVLHNDRSVELMNREAADEIERLRKDRDEAEPLLNELWERRTEATEMREKINRLRAERDEARREICDRVSTTRFHPHYPLMTKHQYAEERGWKCFKEER